MIKLTIEENDKKYEYMIPHEYTEHARQLTLFSGKNPFLIRTSDGKWIYKTDNCNYCGACCVFYKIEKSTCCGIDEYDYPRVQKEFGYKEMDGYVVCKYLEKVKIKKAEEFIPIDGNASSDRKIGNPLKSRDNAILYMCVNSLSPFSCSAGQFNDKCCTVSYKEL